MRGDAQIPPNQVIGKAVVCRDTPTTDDVLRWTGEEAAWSKLDSDNFGQNAWTTYVPTLTAVTTNPTLGSGSTADGTWTRQADRAIHGEARIAFGTSGTNAGSGEYLVSLPVARATTGVYGAGWIYDNSTGAFAVCTLIHYASDTSKARIVAAGGNPTVTHAAPWAWAASDQINVRFTYQAAS
jgi:hypothetical protein